MQVSAIYRVARLHPEAINRVESRIAKPDELLGQRRRPVHFIRYAVEVPLFLNKRLPAMIITGPICRTTPRFVVPGISQELPDDIVLRFDQIGDDQSTTGTQDFRQAGKHALLVIAVQVVHAQRRYNAAGPVSAFEPGEILDVERLDAEPVSESGKSFRGCLPH